LNLVIDLSKLQGLTNSGMGNKASSPRSKRGALKCERLDARYEIDWSPPSIQHFYGNQNHENFGSLSRSNLEKKANGDHYQFVSNQYNDNNGEEDGSRHFIGEKISRGNHNFDIRNTVENQKYEFDF
jgi:hypothetical protein